MAEYLAFENVYGPIGPSYEREVLARILEEIQQLHYNTISMNLGEDQEHPLPKPQPYTRPHELLDEARKRWQRDAPEISLSDEDEEF